MSGEFSYIGIDVGCRSLSAALPGVKPRDFEHSRQGVVRLLQWAQTHSSGKLIAACESSGPYSLRLASLLSECGSPCAIVPPQRVRHNAIALGRRSKTDRIDAQVILDYAMHAQPQPWSVPPPEQQELAALLKAREDLQRETRRWKNRMHALEQLPHAPKETLALALRMIDFLSSERKQLAASCKALLKEYPVLKERFTLLQGIPGIGPEVAMAILARADIFLSRSDKQLTAFAGLAPQHRQSGSSLHGRSHIGKSGDKRLRTLLYMGSLSAAKHHPQLKEAYQRLIDAGKAPTLAHIAVARKLLLQARSVLRLGKPFVPHTS